MRRPAPHPRPVFARRAWALLWVCALAWPARGEYKAAAAAGRPAYVVTIQPLAEIVRRVAGGRAEVTRLIAPTASAHTYEPRPEDAAAVGRATALIYGSPMLDGWVARLPARHKVELMPLVPTSFTLTMPAHEHRHQGEPAEEGHAAGEHAAGEVVDPHFFTDPLAVRAMLPALAEQLAALDPPGGAEYRNNATAFARELEALDGELAGILAPARGAAVILFHPSFRYMLRRYGLDYVSAIEPTPGREATPRDLAEMLGTIRTRHVKALFGEPQLPSRPVRVVAEAAGLPLRELDPYGGAEGRRTLPEMLRYNARVLAEALR